MNIFCHRGLFNNKDIVENTIPAFKAAVKKNLNIELDITMTKDGEIVVFHDRSLKRLTNKQGLIKNLNYKDIKNIKLLNTNDTIPTLEEVLKLVKDKVIILIEIKEVKSYSKILKKLNRILLEYNGRIILQTFDPLLVSIINKTSLKRYDTGLLVSDKYDGIKNKLYNFYIYNYCIKKRYIDFLAIPKSLVFKTIKKTTKEIFIWTIKTKEEFNKYKKYSKNLICEEDALNNIGNNKK